MAATKFSFFKDRGDFPRIIEIILFYICLFYFVRFLYLTWSISQFSLRAFLISHLVYFSLGVFLSLASGSGRVM